MPVIDVPQPEFMEDEEISIFADAVGKFYQQHAPEKRVQTWRDNGQVEREFWNEAGAAGLLGVSVPTEYGGHGGDFRHDMVVIDQQAKNGVDGFAASLHNTVILPYLVRHGTEEQKKKYLPKLVTGELVSAIAMTEPGVGSDLQSITTTALKDGNGYRINGAKTYISNGLISDVVLGAARTHPDNPHAMGLFIVEEGMEGFQRGRRLKKLGLHAQDTAELFFEDVKIPKENVLGDPYKGFKYMMSGLAEDRLAGAAAFMARAERAFEVTMDYITERKAFGKPIGTFQNSRFKMAEMRTDLDMGWVFTDHCTKMHLQGKLSAEVAAEAKLKTSEIEARVVDDCLQLHGGAGYMNEYAIARLWRDARVTRIFGGTSEIMKEVVSREI